MVRRWSLLGLVCIAALGILMLAESQAARAAAVGTSWTYQGTIYVSGSGYTGSCDLRFALYDAAVGGSQVGSTDEHLAVSLDAGLFSVSLDFGQVYDGTELYVAREFRCPAGAGAYTDAGRHVLAPAPMALWSASLSNSATISTTGAITTSRMFVDGIADVALLRVQAHSSQTNNLQTWENSSGTVLSKVTGAGYLDLTQTVNQAATPSVFASQSASSLQTGNFTGVDLTMSTQYIAVKFTASAAHTMGDFQAKIKISGTLPTNPTATLTGYIYADDGGGTSKPTGAALATGKSIMYGTLTTSYQTLSLGTTRTLVNGTAYWLVIKWSAAPAGGGSIVLDSASSADQGATSTDGSTWTNTVGQWYHVIRGLTYYGVYGNSTNSSGVYGNSTNSSGVYGNSLNFRGVYGNSTNEIGVYGNSTNSAGVYGNSTNSSGVYGNSTNFRGVYGSSTNEIGIFGVSANYRGIQGQSTNNTGVFAYSTSGQAFYADINPSSTSSIASIATFRRLTSGTAAAGIGGSIDWILEDDGGTAELTGRISNLLTSASASAEASAMTFWARTGGAAILEIARFDGTGLLLGTTTSPATGTKILTVANGTAPTESVTNSTLLYSADIYSSTDAGLHVRTEGGSVYQFGSLTMTVPADLYVVGTASAQAYVDRTPWYMGAALDAIRPITGTWAGIDHASLPAFARRTITRRTPIFEPRITTELVTRESIDEPGVMITETVTSAVDEIVGYVEERQDGRDLGAMITLLTLGVQQLERQSLVMVPPPAHNDSPCERGQVAVGLQYVYFCIARDTWRRIAYTAGSW